MKILPGHHSQNGRSGARRPFRCSAPSEQASPEHSIMATSDRLNVMCNAAVALPKAASSEVCSWKSCSPKVTTGTITAATAVTGAGSDCSPHFSVPSLTRLSSVHFFFRDRDRGGGHASWLPHTYARPATIWAAAATGLATVNRLTRSLLAETHLHPVCGDWKSLGTARHSKPPGACQRGITKGRPTGTWAQMFTNVA